MDILHLIDRLEEILNESRPFPFTHNVIVDEDRMLDIIDQIIKLIRASRDTDAARHGLMTRFKFSELQANAILEMPLRRLAALERKKLEETKRAYPNVAEMVRKDAFRRPRAGEPAVAG